MMIAEGVGKVDQFKPSLEPWTAGLPPRLLKLFFSESSELS